MAARFICDGCGKEMAAEARRGEWFKPRLWFQRSNGASIQDACSGECLEAITAPTDLNENVGYTDEF